ncbi:Hypothetical protein PROPJV5_0482 [Propionibacterium ruminifibrarum]|uniref:Uncharacterized protein n=1 Tax=Propionibacterium ruminifibrarum TaxID=1962131 RepID=A0A375I1J6_9ACTN|nr:DUF6301 family protein [Propionibacterium ruminifibrarum]SPF67528.1 Hypothetical protein PROPJV5_0482 [Propionibacterium ruminifibrarum]
MTDGTRSQHTDPTYERELPDGTVYRVVPPEVGVPVIRKWLEHDWPMTAQQALALRDELGWTPSPRKETLVTTNLGSGMPKDASITIIKNRVNSFRISLASYAPIELDVYTTPLTHAAYVAYTSRLSGLYGEGEVSRSKTRSGYVDSTTWTLPNHASVQVGTIGSVLSCDIDSPDANYAAAAEAELLEWEAAEEDGDE